jgi:hypothetical protein
MRIVLSVVLALMVGAPARAQVPQAPSAPAAPGIALTAAKTVRCVFPSYAATRWIDGTPETVMGSDDLRFEIDTINLKARTARVVASRASALVSVFVTGTGLVVIEQTPAGNFILTSVFSGGRDGSKLRAVHSRHLGDAAELPTPSQYFGSCEVVR